MAPIQSRFKPNRAPLGCVGQEGQEARQRTEQRRTAPASSYQEWNNIPQRTIDNLVGSMVRRVRAATAVRGGHTRC